MLRKEILTNYDMSDWQAQTIVSLLERGGTKVLVMRAEGSLKEWQADTATWAPMGVTIIRGTVLGAADFSEFEDPGQRYAIRGVDDFVPIASSEWKRVRAEEVIDAILYTGAPRSTAPLMHSLCDDPNYVKMRLARMLIAGLPPRPQKW